MSNILTVYSASAGSGKTFTLAVEYIKLLIEQNTVAMTADKDNHIWLVSLQTGEVWKMRINRFGWKTEQKSFNE